MAKITKKQNKKSNKQRVVSKKTNKKDSTSLFGLSKNTTKYVVAVVILAIMGTVLFKFSNAATVTNTNCSAEGKGENGYLYPICREDAGAHLPINYSLSSLKGDVKFVATNGSDANNGTESAPYLTLAKAISSAQNNGSIVVKNGTYREGNLQIPHNKTLKIIAYPGHIPVFSGAIMADNGWVAEGGLKYHTYTPRPATNGSGVDFMKGENLTGDGVGKYPDQAWIGNRQLKQVSQKAELSEGKFWVDPSSKRLYMTSTDVNKGSVEISGIGKFMSVKSENSILEGITITRYSNTPNEYGVLTFEYHARGAGIRNVEVSDAAFISVMFAGNSAGDEAEWKILKNNFAENVTIKDAGWMGISANVTDYLTLNSVRVTNMNMFEEFKTSPQSGGLKTSRTYYTKVINSDFSDNKSHAIWFDQSNKDAEVANNIISDNTGSGLFYEISDGLLFANNYVKSQGSAQAVKTAGSNGLKFVNNTIIGGKDPVGVYTDSRSMPGCADPSAPYCTTSSGGKISWSGDKDFFRPYSPTNDFMPRIDLMINNIIANPTASGLCGKPTALCISSKNLEANAPIETIIHKAEPGRNIHQTLMNTNVYVNEGGPLVVTVKGSYNTIDSFSKAMASPPVSIYGIDQNSLSGKAYINTDGTPTSALQNNYSKATPVPNDVTLNKYIFAGTKHIGVISAAVATPTPTPNPTPPQPPTNQPPSVSLSGIKASYTEPANIAMTISSSDPDGSVAKVEIYNGNTKLGEIPGTKNSFTWNNAPVGSHSITAKATDDKGDSTTSNAINTKVEAKPTIPTTPPPPPTADTQPPSIPSALSRSLRADWGRGKYVMDLKWSPSVDNSGTVASYQITRNGAVLGTTANTSFTDSLSLKAGTLYTYTVTAKDPSNNTSSPASITAKARCFWFICGLE